MVEKGLLGDPEQAGGFCFSEKRAKGYRSWWVGGARRLGTKNLQRRVPSLFYPFGSLGERNSQNPSKRACGYWVGGDSGHFHRHSLISRRGALWDTGSERPLGKHWLTPPTLQPTQKWGCDPLPYFFHLLLSSLLLFSSALGL